MSKKCKESELPDSHVFDHVTAWTLRSAARWMGAPTRSPNSAKFYLFSICRFWRGPYLSRSLADFDNIYIKMYVKKDAQSDSGIKNCPTAVVFVVFDIPVSVKQITSPRYQFEGSYTKPDITIQLGVPRNPNLDPKIVFLGQFLANLL